MITTKTKNYIFDICIDLRSDNLAFIYVYKGKDLVIISTCVADIKKILDDVIKNGNEKYKK